MERKVDVYPGPDSWRPGIPQRMARSEQEDFEQMMNERIIEEHERWMEDAEQVRDEDMPCNYFFILRESLEQALAYKRGDKTAARSQTRTLLDP